MLTGFVDHIYESATLMEWNNKVRVDAIASYQRLSQSRVFDRRTRIALISELDSTKYRGKACAGLVMSLSVAVQMLVRFHPTHVARSRSTAIDADSEKRESRANSRRRRPDDDFSASSLLI